MENAEEGHEGQGRLFQANETACASQRTVRVPGVQGGLEHRWLGSGTGMVGREEIFLA